MSQGFLTLELGSDVVWKLTLLFSPLLFYILIKVFSSDSGRPAGWLGALRLGSQPRPPGLHGVQG